MNLREWWSTAEWWTYHPSNFLMFSPRIYWRLFESINAAYGPAAWALLALVRTDTSPGGGPSPKIEA